MNKIQIYKTKRHEGRGFTLIEVMVVVTIIALLAAVLIPVTSSVRRQARVVVTKSNINTLNTGVEKFYNDMGSYPSSSVNDPAIDFEGLEQSGAVDVGAHRLVEALVGIDMLGYSTSGYYQYDSTTMEPTLNSPRQGLYVDIEGDNLTVADPRGSEPEFTWDDLNIGAPGITSNLNPMFIDESGYPLECRPILYYKADKREALIGRIYYAEDNRLITEDTDGVGYKYPNVVSANPGFSSPAKVADVPADYDDPFDRPVTDNNGIGNFEGYIWDPASGEAPDFSAARPYNKDTFLLIAAGPDGIYGSEDDICNFQRK